MKWKMTVYLVVYQMQNEYLYVVVVLKLDEYVQVLVFGFVCEKGILGDSVIEEL